MKASFSQRKYVIVLYCLSFKGETLSHFQMKYTVAAFTRNSVITDITENPSASQSKKVSSAHGLGMFTRNVCKTLISNGCKHKFMCVCIIHVVGLIFHIGTKREALHT